MNIIEIILLSFSLSADAFAVSICDGLEMKEFKHKNAVVIAFFFGFFQALMPLIGWALGVSFARYIESFDHWVAFALLALIGMNMIRESFKKDEPKEEFVMNYKKLFIMAIATSIDALAVGIALAMASVNILFAILLIGTITFVICYIGVIIGNKFGDILPIKAELIGGIILILIGVKILLEHLGVINF